MTGSRRSSNEPLLGSQERPERRKVRYIILDWGGVIRANKTSLLEPLEAGLRAADVRMELNTGLFHKFMELERFREPRDRIAALWAISHAMRKDPSLRLEDLFRGESVPKIYKIMRDFHIPDGQLAQATRTYQERLEMASRDIPEVPGAREAIHDLRKLGIPLGILTNEDGKWAADWLRKRELHEHFVPIVGKEELGDKKKPHPDSVRLVLDRFRAYCRGAGLGHHPIHPAQVILVGDNPREDIQAGRSAGCYTVGVLSGRSLRYELVAARAHRIFNSLKQFVDELQKNKMATGYYKI